MTQFTREQLEQGITPGFNEFIGPTELSPDVIEAVIANGQVADNGFIVVEDQIFADEANIGESGAFLDVVGNVRVLGIAPGTSDRDIREIVTEEVSRIQEGGVVFDPNDLVRAFSDFENGRTTAVDLVEEGGIPNPADLAGETVQVDGARIDAAVSIDNENLAFFSDVDVNEEQARQLADERGVQTANGFIVVEDDQFTTTAPNGAIVEAGLILDIGNQFIIKGSGEEAAFGRDAERLLSDFADVEGIDQAVAALNQFDDGDFVDVEVVG